MIRDLISRIREKFSSLYLQLSINIVFGILAGVVIFTLSQLMLDYYIHNNYLTEERKAEREHDAIIELQEMVNEGELSVGDLDKIQDWADSERYVYLMLFSGEDLLFTSDLGIISQSSEPPTSGEVRSNSGLTVDYPTNATLRRYARENERHRITFSDGALLASVAEISEYFYFDLINMLSISMAMLSLSFIVFNYFRRVIKRIKRLEADVTIVTHISMEHKIASKGFDEISRLTSNVENMRNTILENLQREREARDSNTELITAMSHDIRTPLTVLLGYLEMMKSEPDPGPVMREYIDATEKTAMRLKQLSDDMFKYSLAFGDGIEGINLEEYDAGVLFDQMLSEHVLLLREKGYNVIVQNGAARIPGGTTVMTDAQNLMRIVDNVFSNITKYADVNRPVYLTVAFVDGKRVIFECVNTIRTDTYKAESNGIGLKTCARLAQIVAESFEFGENSGRFICRLTMSVEKGSARATEATEETELHGAKHLDHDHKKGEKLSTGSAISHCAAAVFNYVKALFKKKDDEKIKPITNLLLEDGGTLSMDGGADLTERVPSLVGGEDSPNPEISEVIPEEHADDQI